MCPVGGSCLTPAVIYQAEVTRQDDGSQETYVGLTKDPLKTRINQHNSDFSNPKARTKTTLSKHIWNLKDSGLDFQVSWKILSKANPYSPASKGCNLCTTEIFFILHKPQLASLNHRNELWSGCKHRARFKLINNWKYKLKTFYMKPFNSMKIIFSQEIKTLSGATRN